MQNERLIEAVRCREFLYMTGHPRYMDAKLKAAAWRKIGDEMGKPAEVCKKRWQNIRDAFRRSIRRRNATKSEQGANANQSKKHKHDRLLQFLIPELEERETLSSIRYGLWEASSHNMDNRASATTGTSTGATTGATAGASTSAPTGASTGNRTRNQTSASTSTDSDTEVLAESSEEEYDDGAPPAKRRTADLGGFLEIFQESTKIMKDLFRSEQTVVALFFKTMTKKVEEFEKADQVLAMDKVYEIIADIARQRAQKRKP